MSSRLSWISSDSVYNYKFKNNRIEVLLYSAATCQICQGKMVPLFQELAAWPHATWRSNGLRSGADIRLSALDTYNNPRPNIAEAQDISNVPYVQMWAPSRLKYAPLSLSVNFQDTSYEEIRSALLDWIIANANNL